MSIPTPTSSLHRACPQCGKLAALGRRFCGGCRAVLVRPCAACGFGNDKDDVWCGGCGASLSPRATPAGRAAPPPPARPAPAAVVGVAELLAINARRAPLVTPGDTTDQAQLDQLFGESR